MTLMKQSLPLGDKLSEHELCRMSFLRDKKLRSPAI